MLLAAETPTLPRSIRSGMWAIELRLGSIEVHCLNYDLWD